jgi:hypothetical protein
MSSAATNLWNEHDFASGLQFNLVGVLKNLAVNGDGHAFLDVTAEARIFFIQLPHELAERGGFYIELGLATSELVARPA